MRQLLATAGAGSGGVAGLLHNGAFVAAFLGFFFAQSAKVFTHFYTERKWDFTRLVSSGGMPSSHTALVSWLAAGLAPGLPPVVARGVRTWHRSAAVCHAFPELSITLCIALLCNAHTSLCLPACPQLAPPTTHRRCRRSWV